MTETSYCLPKEADFYQKLDIFTAKLEEEIEPLLAPIVKDYFLYAKKPDGLTQGEAILELLIWKVLFDRYQVNAAFKDCSMLICILEETGEYRETVERLKPWISFLKEKGASEINLATEVAVSCMKRYGEKYYNDLFESVDVYASQIESVNPNRKDIALVAKRTPEYYLNLFGAQMLNRIYGDSFKKTKQKYVFLPGCMAYCQENCQAKEGEVGYLCAGCSKECQINQLSAMAEENGAKVVVFYHGSQINLSSLNKQSGKGLIGIACIPNLLEGGYQAKRLGFIPQCVFLTYGGCKQHWNEGGFVTECDAARIREMLQ